MNALYIIEHGSGAEFMQVAVIARELAVKYEKLYVSAINRYFADMLAVELDNVESIDRAELAPLFTTIMNDKSNWIVFNNDVYKTYKFFSRQDNFYDGYRELVGLERKNNWSEKGSDELPELLVPDNIKEEAKKFSVEHPNFVMVQFAGGINPVTPPPERLKILQQPEVGLKRKYPVKDAEKVVELLVKEGYEVLQYCLPEEVHIKGTFYMQEEQNQLLYHELSRYCKGVVCIDSSLMHLSIAHCPKMVVLWGQSASGKNNVEGFGYSKAINLTAKNYTPISPYFNGIPDSPYIDWVKPEDVIKAFKKEKVEETVNENSN